MNRTRTTLLAVTLAFALPAALLAQAPDKAAGAKTTTTKPVTTPKPKVESQATLAKQAKISLDAATATALAKVPGSTVKSHELEREKGKLIYSFDMKIAGKAGIEEVAVDAMTGDVIGKVEHEDDPAPKKPATTPPVKKTGGG